MMQSYILSHSPSFRMKEKNLTVDLMDDEWKGFFVGPVIDNYEVKEPAKDQKFVRLEIHLVNSKKSDKSMNLSLPLSEFDFRFLNQDLTTAEKQMIVRWLNQNWKVDVLQGAKPALKVSWNVAI